MTDIDDVELERRRQCDIELEARRRRYAEFRKLCVTKEEKERWAEMMHLTWHAIGPDAMQAMEDSGQRLTRAIIVEFVLDANRVQEFAGMTNEEYEFLTAQYDRPAFQRWARGIMNY